MQFGAARLPVRRRQALTELADVEAARVGVGDQADDRGVQAVGRQQRRRARIDGQVRLHDALQGGQVELVQRQPLAE